MIVNSRILQEYLKGELSEAESQEVQLWLGAHMDEPEVIELLDRQFDDSFAGESSEDALSTTRVRLGLDRPRHRLPWLWISAAAVICLAVAIPLSIRAGYRLHPESEPVCWQEMIVPTAQTRSISLPDGTSLTLNAGSRLTWPDRFDGSRREVFLDGEVLAKVAHNPETPFVIHCGEVDVRVHGTSFDLKTYRNATMLEVILTDGSLSLDIPSSEGRREIRMTPGDILQYDRDEGNVMMGRTGPEGIKTFADNRSFSFINIPLEDIIEDLQRSFGVSVIIADPAIASQRFLAFFTNGESLDEILGLLAANGNLRISRRGDAVYLYGRK